MLGSMHAFQGKFGAERRMLVSSLRTSAAVGHNRTRVAAAHRAGELGLLTS